MFGGTFDPPHIGHLVAARDACDQLGLDRVLLVVANVPWQKVGERTISPVADRWAMVRAATDGSERLEACDVEIRRGGPSYMVDTLDELRRALHDAALYLLVGTDTAAGLATWHDWERLAGLARLVVFPRPGSQDERPPLGVEFDLLDTPQLEVSSTDLRERVREGRTIEHLVPDAVRRVIGERGLYR